jgi:hypothetical protein
MIEKYKTLTYLQDRLIDNLKSTISFQNTILTISTLINIILVIYIEYLRNI